MQEWEAGVDEDQSSVEARERRTQPRQPRGSICADCTHAVRTPLAQPQNGPTNLRNCVQCTVQAGTS